MSFLLSNISVTSTFPAGMCCLEHSTHRRTLKTEGKAKVVAAVWGTELIKFLATLAIFHQDDWKKRMSRITATWRNGFFGRMIIRFTPYQTTTLPAKWRIFQKTFVQNVSSLLLNSQCGIQVRSPTNSDDLCLLFWLDPSSMAPHHPQVLASRQQNFATSPKRVYSLIPLSYLFIYSKYLCVSAQMDGGWILPRLRTARKQFTIKMVIH